jgi:hypothetical protein
MTGFLIIFFRIPAQLSFGFLPDEKKESGIKLSLMRVSGTNFQGCNDWVGGKGPNRVLRQKVNGNFRQNLLYQIAGHIETI